MNLWIVSYELCLDLVFQGLASIRNIFQTKNSVHLKCRWMHRFPCTSVRTSVWLNQSHAFLCYELSWFIQQHEWIISENIH